MKKHIKRIQEIHQASEAAIDVFTRTENQLLQQNTELEKVVSEIEQEIAALSSLKQSAIDRHTTNTTVIGNIAKILRGGNA